MSDKPLLVVVLGYGCHLSEDMKRYLDAVTDFVVTHHVHCIITTGGYTNRTSAPEVSEAGLMADYLSSQVSTAIKEEKKARTTKENLEFVSRIIQQDQLEFSQIVIFCDKSRAPKVRLLARLILEQWPKICSVQLSKGLIQRGKQLFIATPLDVLSLWIPALEKKEIHRRERIMDKS